MTSSRSCVMSAKQLMALFNSSPLTAKLYHPSVWGYIHINVPQ